MKKITFIAVSLVIMLVLAFLIIGASENRVQRECAAAQLQTGLQTRISENGTCQIEVTPGSWYALDLYYWVEDMNHEDHG